MSDIHLQFDRNLAGGFAEGDRVTIARSDFVDGLIGSGVAHEITDADINPAVPADVPVLVEPYDDATVDDLAAELGRRGLVKTGAKADLVARLRDNDTTVAADADVVPRT